MSWAWSIWGLARGLCTSGCWNVLEEVSSDQTPKAALPSLNISCTSHGALPLSQVVLTRWGRGAWAGASPVCLCV